MAPKLLALFLPMQQTSLLAMVHPDNVPLTTCP